MIKPGQNKNKFCVKDKIDDEFAWEISWAPLKTLSSNFTTRKLKYGADGTVVFAPTLVARIFPLAFIGGGLYRGTLFRVSMDKLKTQPLEALADYWLMIKESFINQETGGLLLDIALIVFGLVLLYSLIFPVVFNKPWKFFRTGYSLLGNKRVDFDDIYAVQLLSDVFLENETVNFQINLVLKNKERINVVSHKNRNKAILDANTIGNLISRPVWNLA